MYWTRTSSAFLGLTILLGTRAESQKPKEFLTGMCPVPDSLAHPDLSALADSPAHPPVILAERMAGSTKKLYDEDVKGSVTAAVVVDTAGHIVPGSMAVMSSSHPELSKWVCSLRDKIYFKPATDSAGKPVMAQVALPYSFNVEKK